MNIRAVTIRWLQRLFACTLLLTLPCLLSAQNSGNQIVIVKSSDNSYFNQTIETLINQVDLASRFKVVRVEELNAEISNLTADDLIISLGQMATEALINKDVNSKIINAYLTQEQYQNLEVGNNQTTIFLDQPLQRYINFSRLLLPVNSIGIIAGNTEVLEYTQSGTQTKLEINQYQLGNSQNLLPLLRQLLQQNDTLLMLPQQSIFNRNTLKSVLLTAYRSRKPVISYSPAHVKSGALASIYSSPSDIGRHLAAIVNHLHKTRSRISQPYQFPRFYSIVMNARVAHALGLELPNETQLRRQLEKVNQ